MLAFCSIPACWSTYQTHHYSFCELFIFSSGHWPSKHFRVHEKFNPQPQKHQAADQKTNKPRAFKLNWASGDLKSELEGRHPSHRATALDSRCQLQRQPETFSRFRRLWTGAPQLLQTGKFRTNLSFSLLLMTSLQTGVVMIDNQLSYCHFCLNETNLSVNCRKNVLKS